MIDFGIPLLIGYALLPSVFILLSYYLFQKTEFANYADGLFALSFISKLSEPKRNDFLKSIFMINRLKFHFQKPVYTLKVSNHSV